MRLVAEENDVLEVRMIPNREQAVVDATGW